MIDTWKDIRPSYSNRIDRIKLTTYTQKKKKLALFFLF